MRGPKLLSIDEVPPHLRFNKYVVGSYRPMGESKLQAVVGLFTYLHNETLHVYTHALPAAYCIWELLTTVWVGQPAHYLFHFLAIAVIGLVFVLSTNYHTFMSTVDEAGYKALLLADVMAIWVLHMTITACVLFLGFPCVALIPKLLVLTLAGIPSAYRLLAATTPAARVAGFGWLMLVRMILYAARFTYAAGPPIEVYIFNEVVGILCGIVNVLRFPERFAPGQWDFFDSHCIMHILAAASMLLFARSVAWDCNWIDAVPRDAQCVQDEVGSLWAAMMSFAEGQ